MERYLGGNNECEWKCGCGGPVRLRDGMTHAYTHTLARGPMANGQKLRLRYSRKKAENTLGPCPGRSTHNNSQMRGSPRGGNQTVFAAWWATLLPPGRRARSLASEPRSEGEYTLLLLLRRWTVDVHLRGCPNGPSRRSNVAIFEPSVSGALEYLGTPQCICEQHHLGPEPEPDALPGSRRRRASLHRTMRIGIERRRRGDRITSSARATQSTA